MSKVETLRELTGQESGIIIFPSEADQLTPIGVYNWLECKKDQIPMVLAEWLPPIPMEAGEDMFEDAEHFRVANLLEYLIGFGMPTDDDRYMIKIIYDRNDELGNLSVEGADIISAECYELTSGMIIIAPDGWN